MQFKNTPIDGLVIIEPTIYGDHRGCFFEAYRKELFEDFIQEKVDFVQENQSMSMKGVLRGLHYQEEGWAQAKLVSVVQGAVLDIVLDMRVDSRTYGKTFQIKLDSQNKNQLYIPRGFAHGFLTLEDGTIFSYKVDNYYHPEAEKSINILDRSLGIELPDMGYIMSDKDKDAINFV